MKIIQDSPDKLILKQSATSGRIIGLVFLLAGIGMGVYGVKSTKALLLFGVVFALVGLLVMLLIKSDVVTADIPSKQLSVTFSSLKDKNGKSQNCKFEDVSAVLLTQGYTTTYNNAGGNQSNGVSFGNAGNGAQTQIQMNLSIQLRTGNSWTVANEQHQVSGGLGVSSNKLPAIGQKLADTLGVPFQQVGAQTVGQPLQSVAQAVKKDPSQPLQ